MKPAVGMPVYIKANIAEVAGDLIVELYGARVAIPRSAVVDEHFQPFDKPTEIGVGVRVRNKGHEDFGVGVVLAFHPGNKTYDTNKQELAEWEVEFPERIWWCANANLYIVD